MGPGQAELDSGEGLSERPEAAGPDGKSQDVLNLAGAFLEDEKVLAPKPYFGNRPHVHPKRRCAGLCIPRQHPENADRGKHELAGPEPLILMGTRWPVTSTANY